MTPNSPTGPRELTPSTRRIVLTCDVEAFSLRAKTQQVDKLIWGLFPEGDFGLERIMALVERVGARLSAFLDFPGYYAYGEDVLDVGREIVKRGHDLNLHLHLDCLPPDFFSTRGLRNENDLNKFTDEGARACLDDLLELHSRVTSERPVALRGGAYRYNGAMLRALKATGVPISSNYNPAVAKYQPYDLGSRRQFLWETGTIELPIATQVGFLKRAYATHFNFNISPFMVEDTEKAIAHSLDFLDQFYAEHGEAAVAVFVLHSWSFLNKDEAGEFSIVNPAAPERLTALLTAWSERARFVTARDLARLAQTGQLELDGPVAIPDGEIARS